MMISTRLTLALLLTIVGFSSKKGTLFALAQPIRVNAGGYNNATGTGIGEDDYTDTNGNVWTADTNSTGNTASTTASIDNTDDDPLYQTELFDVQNFNFAVQNGEYQVRLHFAEIGWNNANNRVFNVSVEGEIFLENFDIWEQAGGRYVALIESTVVNVMDGSLDISFANVVDVSQISAIEILSTGGKTKAGKDNIFPTTKAPKTTKTKAPKAPKA